MVVVGADGLSRPGLGDGAGKWTASSASVAGRPARMAADPSAGWWFNAAADSCQPLPLPWMRRQLQSLPVPSRVRGLLRRRLPCLHGRLHRSSHPASLPSRQQTVRPLTTARPASPTAALARLPSPRPFSPPPAKSAPTACLRCPRWSAPTISSARPDSSVPPTSAAAALTTPLSEAHSAPLPTTRQTSLRPGNSVSIATHLSTLP